MNTGCQIDLCFRNVIMSSLNMHGSIKNILDIAQVDSTILNCAMNVSKVCNVWNFYITESVAMLLMYESDTKMGSLALGGVIYTIY